MSADEYLGLWMAMTITVDCLSTVVLFMVLLPRLVRWVRNTAGGS
jgi:hypothetical protein